MIGLSIYRLTLTTAPLLSVPLDMHYLIAPLNYFIISKRHQIIDSLILRRTKSIQILEFAF
jgi:hypothetical protein